MKRGLFRSSFHSRNKLFIVYFLFISMAFNLPMPTFASVNSGMVLGASTESMCTNMKSRMLYGKSDEDTFGEVSQLQYFLKENGYFNAKVTGYFGSITMDAIKEFQKDNELIVTGIAGKITRAKISDLGCVR